MKTFNSLIYSLCLFTGVSIAKVNELPHRGGPRPATTSGVPHKQLGVKAVKKIHTELMRRTFSIPGIKKGPSFTPYRDAVGILLDEKVPVIRPRAILSQREFSHFHPDGSLHAPLPLKRALEAVKKSWAVRHPWATQRKGWDGLVLIYTPTSKKEQEVVFQLIVESFNFVTGKKIDATDYP